MKGHVELQESSKRAQKRSQKGQESARVGGLSGAREKGLVKRKSLPVPTASIKRWSAFGPGCSGVSFFSVPELRCQVMEPRKPREPREPRK